MRLLRRFLVLAALFFWQGGFTFYAAVVVPVGQEVFGHRKQGFVTREVTVYLNLAGAVALLILLGDLLVDRGPAWRWGRRLLWAAMLLSLGALFWLHGRLEELLVPDDFALLDSVAFRPRHRLYLWISTVQWACALLYLWLTLAGWRREDQSIAENSAVSVVVSKNPAPPNINSCEKNGDNNRKNDKG